MIESAIGLVVRGTVMRVPGWSDTIPALVGVAVGSALSFASSWLSDRNRWKRDHSARWDERRLGAYVAYADALKSQIRITRRLAATMYADDVIEPIDELDARCSFAIAEDKRASFFESVLLLGTADTIKAARDWQRAVWEMYYHLLSPESTLEQFSSDFVRTGDARELFLVAARLDLNIGDLLDPRPPWNWPEDRRQRGS